MFYSSAVFMLHVLMTYIDIHCLEVKQRVGLSPGFSYGHTGETSESPTARVPQKTWHQRLVTNLNLKIDCIAILF